MNPAVRSLLAFFRYKHLPAHLQAVSAPFGRQAASLVRNVPSSAELTVALRKLLESKDAAVRAALPAFEGDDEALLAELEG